MYKIRISPRIKNKKFLLSTSKFNKAEIMQLDISMHMKYVQIQ